MYFLKSATVGVFTPQKLANAPKLGLFLKESVIKRLPAPHWFHPKWPSDPDLLPGVPGGGQHLPLNPFGDVSGL